MSNLDSELTMILDKHLNETEMRAGHKHLLVEQLTAFVEQAMIDELTKPIVTNEWLRGEEGIMRLEIDNRLAELNQLTENEGADHGL